MVPNQNLVMVTKISKRFWDLYDMGTRLREPGNKKYCCGTMVTACWCENSPSIDRSRVRCYSKVKNVYLYKKSIYIYLYLYLLESNYEYILWQFVSLPVLSWKIMKYYQLGLLFMLASFVYTRWDISVYLVCDFLTVR